MKVYITQDDNGMLHLFTKKPKRVPTQLGSYVWCVESGECVTLQLNNPYQGERVLRDDGLCDTITFADLLGLKPTGRKHGVMCYKGINPKEARECELKIDLALLDDYGHPIKR